jgi:23S rRNA (adenine1618-N6)-methyltransferase
VIFSIYCAMQKGKPAEKQNLHLRNLHRQGYDFDALIAVNNELAAFVKPNQYGNKSVDFADPNAVLALNKALLKHYYSIDNWNIPEGYLCPPIPGRADYMHYMADLLAESSNGNIPTGRKIRVLDMGTGANGIYPLLGTSVYGWQFVATDVEPFAITAFKQTLAANPTIKKQIECRLQINKSEIFKGIIQPTEKFDLVVCNPPFHASREEAWATTNRKWENLSKGKTALPTLNFGGKSNELWSPGGEAAFITRMAEESVLFGSNCLWFTTLVSKKETLTKVQKVLGYFKATEVKIINMAQGQKVSRALAWTFLNAEERANWAQRWI